MSRFFAQLRRKDNREAKHQSGQALAETALVLIIVVLLLGGLVEFGWAYFRYLALQGAAGEGAAYAMMFPRRWFSDADKPSSDWDDCVSPDPDNIVYRVQNESQSDILDWSATDVEVDSVFTTPGNPITVTVSFEHDLITPLVSDWVSGGTITLRASAVQNVVVPSSTTDNRCGP
jgi:Flp pilus assembly protein TadG